MRNSRRASVPGSSRRSSIAASGPRGALALVFASLLAAAPLFADLSAIKTEPNLERRAAKALDHAEASLKAAQDAYAEGGLKEANAALDEMREAVELAYQALMATGKNPSRSPRHFKRAEIRTRDFLRRLGDFRDKLAFNERDTLDNTRAAIEKIHDKLLAGIMGGRKR